jgi:hypothetical protein
MLCTTVCPLVLNRCQTGALLEKMTARQVFMLTALLPLLVSAAALLVDEKPVGPSGTSVQDVVSHLHLL